MPNILVRRPASSSMPLVGPQSVLARPQVGQQTPQQRQQAQMVEDLVQPEVWTMFDTITVGVSTNAPSDYNFTTIPATIPLFNKHTIGSAGYSITSMTTNSGYVDFPYKAFGVGVEVFADTDAGTNTGVTSNTPGITFVESIVNWGALTLTFATDLKFVIPISDMPAGGGVVYGPRTFVQATAADSQLGTAANGIQSIQARALWKEYILFRGKDTPFTVNLTIQSIALAKINALTALAGNEQAGIRVKFWGYRGKRLVTGAPFRG